MLHTYDWIAIIGYIVLALGVGTYMAKRASASTQDFYLAGRKLPWWVAGTSLVATSFAADTPLVVSGWVRSAGISQNWLWWGMAVGGSLSFVMIAAWWRRLEVTTDAELIEHRYGGTQAKVLRGFLGAYHALITNTIVLVWVLVAMKKIVVVVLDLPEDQNWDYWILGCGVFLALVYSFMSGLWGVVVTDFFQFFLAMGGALLLAWKASEAMGGLDAARDAFAAMDESTTAFLPSAKIDPGTGDPYAWTHPMAWASGGFGAFMIFFGVQGWLNKNADGGGQAVQRFSACKDESHARGTALWFHIAHYAVRPWPWIFVALASIVLIQDDMLPQIMSGGEMGPDHEAAYPLMMRNLLGPGLFGLMCASFFAAFMSTLDTHFNLASAYLVNDCYRRFLAKDKNPRHYVWVGRFLEIFIGIVAGVLASFADSINDLFTFLLTLLGGLGPAMLLRWFWWRANAWTEISAMLTSTIGSLMISNATFQAWAVESLGAELKYPLTYVLVVGLSTIVMVSVTLLTQPVASERLTAFTKKVRPIGFWGPYKDRSQPSRRIPVMAGWLGGVTLIYSLLFLPGAWLLDRDMLPYEIGAIVGATMLRWSWRRTVT
ncbi:MAG: Na+:solute symporter [Planctomycetes bacterium]|nr:Na+:solute symporter [Planctomycetota bacterium]